MVAGYTMHICSIRAIKEGKKSPLLSDTFVCLRFEGYRVPVEIPV